MASPVSTSVESLDGNKVRLHVAIPASEFEKAIDAAFRKLAADVKIPGFRPGKAPRQLLEARFGPDVARREALQDALPGYYASAIDAEELDAIAPPEIDITSGEDAGDVEFDAVVEIRPVATLSGYDGLRVEVPSPTVTDEAIDAQIDALRDRFADLTESAAPLTDGDYAEIDIKGYVHDEAIDGLTATDFLYEVGSEMVVPKLDEEVRGKRPGDILKFNDVLPERFGDRAGEEVGFQVLVKDAKRKVLPDVDDDWVSEVSEFDTVDELRADIGKRLELVGTVQAQMAARDKVLEAAAELVDVDIPDALVQQEMERRLHDLAHRLEAQGADIAQYLEATGQEQQSFVDAVRQGAVAGVRADLALRAVVAHEGVEVTEDELAAEVARLAERMEEKPAKVRRDLEHRGLLEAVRSDLARGKALQVLVDRATVVDEQGNPLDLTLPESDANQPEGSEPEDSEPEDSEPEEESPA
ncbi:MAG: trigger factor [Acidimicrobiia bacterium]